MELLMKNCFLTPRTNTTKRRGFTLIEILVVIAVIMLLAGISFPVFSRVREGGRRTACTNNIRQLGMAFAQYAGDNGGRLPFAANYQAWEPGRGYWVAGTVDSSGLAADTSPFEYKSPKTANVEGGSLFPYVKEAKTYICPSTPDGDKKKLSYSMNCAVSGLSQVRFRTPSEIILLVDEGKSLNDGYFWASMGGTAKATDELTTAHNGGGNILFYDGHVKFFQFEALPIKADSPIRTSTTVGQPRFRDLAFGAGGVAQTGFYNEYADPKRITSACP